VDIASRLQPILSNKAPVIVMIKGRREEGGC
jgi:hypothetical protein